MLHSWPLAAAWSVLTAAALPLLTVPPSPCACSLSLATATQVLVTSGGRVRIGCLGVAEVLAEVAGYQDVPQVGGCCIICWLCLVVAMGG